MNLLRPVFLTCASLALLQKLAAQNLVPNGSFEDYTRCPGGYVQHSAEFRAKSWRSITPGTPDYFNACSGGEADVPYNWAGVSDPYEGYGYAGIYVWMVPKDYREYLHCKLTEPLIRDSVYMVSFRYKLSSYSKYCADRIGLLLSDSLKQYQHDGPLGINPTFSYVKDSALTLETGSWELASAEYKATGGEQFLTIGNFDGEDTRTYYIRFRPAAEPMVAESAYYYIDDVQVIPRFDAPPPQTELPVFARGETELNTVYVLENIQFEFNSYALMPVSHIDLDKVVKYLAEHPDVSVRLSGHTDDLGDHAYNLWLSDSRAKSAAAYLISQGIDESRIVAIGFGESKPLVDDVTEESRRKNRRVEIEFDLPR